MAGVPPGLPASFSSAIPVQLQVRRNAEEMQDAIRDLTNWQSDIKKRDKAIKKSRPGSTAAASTASTGRAAAGKPKKVSRCLG